VGHHLDGSDPQEELSKGPHSLVALI
jgi:hypothetical protein